MKNFNEDQSPAVLKASGKSARASWSAAALCRFSMRADVRESGRGLPQSKTWRTFGNFLFTASTAVFLIALAGCSKPAAAPEKLEAEHAGGVTMDAETQARIGLKIETPAAMEWQPEIHATGRVVDPLAFTAAAADYETARAAAISSQSELSRTQKLAEQNNASARVLEAATAAAARDALALKSAQAKFTADWGRQLAAQTNLTTFAEKLQVGDVTFVKLSLPAGMFPEVLPTTATVSAFGNETNFVPADLADNLAIDAPTQMQSLLFSSRQKLSPGVAVTARLKMAGAPLSGVLIPASAVVQHDGKAWAYVQTQTNQFTRGEVPQDRGVAEGWFVQENFSATSRIVAGGEQMLLSAEFSTGEGAHEH